jgi:hypothetical protein
MYSKEVVYLLTIRQQMSLKGKILSISIAIAVLFISCGKDELPTPLTSYNFSATANGEFVTYNAVATYNPNQDTMNIAATWITNIGQTYQLELERIHYLQGFKGTYQLNGYPGTFAEYVGYTLNPTSMTFAYFTTQKYTGTVNISTYDTIAHTISGTFSFQAFDGDETVVNVSNGVFTKVPVTQ